MQKWRKKMGKRIPKWTPVAALNEQIPGFRNHRGNGWRKSNDSGAEACGIPSRQRPKRKEADRKKSKISIFLPPSGILTQVKFISNLNQIYLNAPLKYLTCTSLWIPQQTASEFHSTRSTVWPQTTKDGAGRFIEFAAQRFVQSSPTQKQSCRALPDLSEPKTKTQTS